MSSSALPPRSSQPSQSPSQPPPAALSAPPPSGYALEAQVPAFLRPAAATAHIVDKPPDNRSIALVSSDDPTEIDVHEPSQFHSPQLIHEMTHVFQFSRNPEMVNQMRDALRTGKLPATYTYGGTDGLIAARQAGKTIADFGPEQQAEMVKNYAVLTKQAIQSGNAAELDRIKQAYGPFIRQLAALPGKTDSLTQMTQRDLTPAAPGLPPAAESGILAPDDLLGGAAGVYNNPAEAAHARSRVGSRANRRSPRRDITPPPGYHIEN